MKIDFEIGKYGEDLLVKSDEEKAAKEFKFYPEPPITILNALVSMHDDYNGRVEIELSNGETVIYNCKEVTGDVPGPFTEMSVMVTRVGQCGFKICGNEFGENYLGNQNSWIDCIMQCYMDSYKNRLS